MLCQGLQPIRQWPKPVEITRVPDPKVSKRDELRLSKSWRKRVGVALRDARTNAGLTQPKLAERAGLDWTTISQIENGASAPDLATMEAISDALGVSLDTAAGRMGQERRESAQRFWHEPLTPPAASDKAGPPWAARSEVQKLSLKVRSLQASLTKLTRSRAAGVEENLGRPATPPSDVKKPARQRRRKKAG